MAKQDKQVKKPRKVWRIYRFRERFDIAETSRYCRKSALIYTRDFVGTSGGDEAITYQQQIDLLRNCAMHHLMLRGAFHALKAVAANRSMTYRGYLLDHKNAPASNGLIAMWLGINAAETKKVVKDLAAVGLIEQVDLPVFDESLLDDGPDGPDSPDNPPEGGNGQDGVNGPTEDDSPAEGDAAAQDGPADDLANISEYSREVAKTLQNGKAGNAVNETGIGKSGIPEKLKEKEKKENEKCKGKEQRKEINASSCRNAGTPDRQAVKVRRADFEAHCRQRAMLESNPDAKATGSETKSHNEATAQQAPASAPVPINPTVPEALGVQCDDDFVPPPSPDYKPRVADPDGLAKSFVGIEVFYDPSCRQFALDIYHCLQIPGCIDSPNNKSELGCFAQAWSNAQQEGLPPSALAKLWERSIAAATKIGKERKRKTYSKGPEAVWRYQFNQRLDSMVNDYKSKSKEVM